MDKPDPVRDEEGDGPVWGLAQAFVLVSTCAFLAGGVFFDGDRRLTLLICAALGLLSLGLSISSPIPRRSARVGDYWWAGLIPLGVGTWATFAYIGWRFRSPRLLLAAGCYLAGLVGVGLLNLAAHDEGLGSAVAAGLMAADWLVGGLHGFAIRRSVRARFESLKAAS